MSEVLLKKILENAVKIEEESYALYTKAQDKARLPSSKALLVELAEAELGHKEKLLAIMQGSASVYWAGVSELGSPTDEVEDLKIVDYLKDTSLSDDADYPAILIYAGKREKMTYEHYNSLATGPFAKYFPEVSELFFKLAQEELMHKNRIEREYEEHVLKED
jgi:rubrerythrin